MTRRNQKFAVYALSVCALLSAVLPGFVSAEISLHGFGTSLTLTMSPQNPEPNESVRITVENSFLDLSTSEITWTANGNIVSKGIGETSVDIVAGAFGTRTDVSVSVVDIDGAIASASLNISPSQVDLLYDAASFVPVFYRGRALASAGTSLRLQALAYFPGNSGTLPDSSIIFTWRRNGQVLNAISGRGRSSAVISAPELFSTDVISVDAKSVDGQISGGASIRIPSVDPVIALYMDHPLFGIMYHQKIRNVADIRESTATFAAIPYFADGSSAADPGLEFAWRVNDATVAASTSKQNELTINATSPGAQAKVELDLSSRRNIFMSASNRWNLTFASGGGQTPSGTENKDIFHSGE